MHIENEFKELQIILAKIDLITGSSKHSNNDLHELLLLKYKNLKYKIYQEQGHKIPHIHIDYNKQTHVASYSIQTGERLKGGLNRKYDREISCWILHNQNNLLKIWTSLQNGSETSSLIGELIE